MWCDFSIQTLPQRTSVLKGSSSRYYYQIKRIVQEQEQSSYSEEKYIRNITNALQTAS